MVKLLQERFANDPYRVLLSSMLLIRTQAKVVKNIIPVLFKEYPTAGDLAKAKESDLRRILNPGGLQNVRARQLKRFAKYIKGHGFPKSQEEFKYVPYVGKYVADAYSIFILRNFAICPTDKKLQHYLQTIKPLKDLHTRGEV